MSDAIPVIIPLLNPNEPEALLAELHIQSGQSIATGDKLCTLETTKSTVELLAEAGGYVAGLNASQGQTVHAGDILCFLAQVPGWQTPTQEKPDISTSHLPPGLRITQPALVLARQHDLDLNQLPAAQLITIKHIERLITRPTSSHLVLPDIPTNSLPLVVYGGGGHGKALIDLLRLLDGYTIMGVLDDNLTPGERILDVPILGGAEFLPELVAHGVTLAVNAVGGIGNVGVRVKVFQLLADAGLTCPALVHPRAFVESSAQLADGVQVFPHAYIGSAAQIGYGAIVNTAAIVSHDCQVGDYANISPGAILAGEVQVGEQVLVGMGVTINLQVKIGRGARIGNGATVKSDVPAGGIVHAGTIWPLD